MAVVKGRRPLRRQGSQKRSATGISLLMRMIRESLATAADMSNVAWTCSVC
jgi:hypothetical protein